MKMISMIFFTFQVYETMADTIISEADSTTKGLNDPKEAHDLILAYIRLAKHIKHRQLRIREYDQGSEINQERFNEAFYIACVGCGTKIETLILRCPNFTTLCRESSIFFFKRQ